MGELLFAYPLEYIKTQLQLSAVHLDAPVASAGSRAVNPRSYANSWELIRYTYGRFGAFGFYRGMSSCMLFAFPRGMTRFVTYEACIKELEAFYHVDGISSSSISLSPTATLLAGLAAGLVEGAVCVVPMTTLQVKFCHDLSLEAPRYRGLLHGVRTIVKEDGWSGLYQGFGPTVVKIAMNMAMRFTLYEQCCNWLLRTFGSRDGKLSPWQTLTSGAIAGATSVVINHPIDVVKSNMQGLRGREFRSSWHCGQVIYRSEGVRGLYKGLGPRVACVVMETSLVFTFYDQISRMIDAWTPQ